MTFHSLSIFSRGRVLSLYSTSHLATQARIPSLTVPFWTTSKTCQGMYILKNLSSAMIYLYRSWCPICKQLHRGPSLKNSYSSIPLYYPEILYHFQSTICHPHIISESPINATVLSRWIMVEGGTAHGLLPVTLWRLMHPKHSYGIRELHNLMV